MTDQLTANAPATPEVATPLFGPDAALRALMLSREELDERRIVGFHSRDHRSRPYHLLRSQLLKIMGRNNLRMIGVTSATPGAGKTFTSVNLAAALSATSEAPVVLCDLDLRRGSIQDMVQDESDLGLADYLEGKLDDPGELAFRVNDSNLVLVTTLPSEQSSSELIASPRFRSFMARLRAMPDNVTIVCDLPPVFANDDTMMTMQYLDGYVLVVDHGMSTARQVEEAVRLLEPVPCLGTVLNRYKGGFADPYGYGYGDTYGMKTYG